MVQNLILHGVILQHLTIIMVLNIMNLEKKKLDENKSISLETSLKTINTAEENKEHSADKDGSISDVKKIEKSQSEAS